MIFNSKIILKKFSTKQTLSSIIQKLNIECKEDKEIKYEDNLFYFEKEWKKLQEEKNRLHQNYPTNDLTDHQQRELDILLESIDKFSGLERNYFFYTLEDYFNKNYGVSFDSMNLFDKRTRLQIKNDNSLFDPNFLLTEDIIKSLLPFISSGYFSGSSAPTQETTTNVEQKKEEKKLVEKAICDVKLTGFVAEKKINLIKEVRSLLNLGLKESKEFVEKTPATIAKAMARPEAEELKKKLIEAGGIIELE